MVLTECSAHQRRFGKLGVAKDKALDVVMAPNADVAAATPAAENVE